MPTQACQDLRPVVFGLAEWGARWAFGEPRADELDATVLMWWMRGGIDAGARSATASGRSARAASATGTRRRFWLVVQATDVSLCFTDPGFDVDVTVEADLDALYEVWDGRMEYGAAVRDRRLVVTGETPLVRALPRSLLLSPMAPYVRQAVGAPA